MTFAVFCIAAALVALLAPRIPSHNDQAGGPRREGIVFVGAVLLACLAGLYVTQGARAFALDNLSGFALVLLAGALYILAAVRGKLGLPPFVADILVLLAAGVALQVFRYESIGGIRLPFSNQFAAAGSLAVPITLAFVWLIARLAAALNRTPKVSGGYLGIVGLTFCILGALQNIGGFPTIAGAALAGAGLASVPFALKRESWNLGWSAALAMGFLLAQSALLGLWKNFAFALLALLFLVLGLPLLDVLFGRARQTKTPLRLHQVLERRGLSGAKVSFIYLVLAAWLCGLGILLVATETWNLGLRALLLAIVGFGGGVFFLSIVRVLMSRADDESVPENIEAFGVRISPVSMSEAMDRIEEMIQSQKPHHVVTSDANAILRAQHDEEYAGILGRAALVTPDGYGVIWGARLLNLPVYERVTGVDMVTGICARAAQKGYRIFILGSEPGVAATAGEKLQQSHPGLEVAGTQHGFYKDEGLSEDAIVERIRLAKPDVLFVAFGIPAQEKFIARNMEKLGVPVSLGVGGSFDVYSEKLRRAPEAIQRSGLEWLYRVWQEPWRWKRMGYVPRFMWFALKEWLGITHITRDQKKRGSKV